jgi:uncharacterized membrane protein
MRHAGDFVVHALVGGLLVIAPIYLAVLLLLKAMESVWRLVRPFTQFVPDWFPAETLLSLLIVLTVCFLIGVAIQTPFGRAIRNRIESSIFEKIPGYAMLRSLTQQVAKESHENAWKPALAEIEEALVPAFIIEECEGNLFTVFVPAIPAPLTGAVYILTSQRVHPLDIPFTQMVKVISKWGSGSKALVAAMNAAAR